MDTYVDTAQIEARLEEVRRSPSDQGSLARIVARPSDGERADLELGELTLADGLVGDNWRARGSRKTPDGSAHPEMQLNLTNSRFLNVIAPEAADQRLAGDQLHVDLDLSEASLGAGTRLRIGSAVIEITAEPHNGCAKYRRRFGEDALAFVNSPLGKELHLRGVNAKVVEPGIVRVGDAITKVVADA